MNHIRAFSKNEFTQNASLSDYWFKRLSLIQHAVFPVNTLLDVYKAWNVFHIIIFLFIRCIWETQQAMLSLQVMCLLVWKSLQLSLQFRVLSMRKKIQHWKSAPTSFPHAKQFEEDWNTDMYLIMTLIPETLCFLTIYLKTLTII